MGSNPIARSIFPLSFFVQRFRVHRSAQVKESEEIIDLPTEMEFA